MIDWRRCRASNEPTVRSARRSITLLRLTGYLRETGEEAIASSMSGEVHCMASVFMELERKWRCVSDDEDWVDKENFWCVELMRTLDEKRRREVLYLYMSFCKRDCI